jgi:hypothetical protein
VAKIKFGNIVADARGKLGGVVYSRNRGGAYVRSKVTPVNPQSPYQLAVRARLADLSGRWHADLTEAIRLQWEAFATAHPRVDVFGEQRVLSGLAMYQALNGIALGGGGARMDGPPVDLDVVALTAMTAELDTSTPLLNITFAGTPLGAGIKLYVWATPAISSTRTFWKPQLRFLGVSAAAQASPFDAMAMWNARFGSTPNPDEAVGLLVATVDVLKGAVSVGLSAKVIGT